MLTLDAFGEEAAYCVTHDESAFAALVRVVQLDPDRFRLATGAWGRAVLDWAQTGQLNRFLARLNGLPPDRLAVAEQAPAALPLLCLEDAPTVQAMLLQHGDRASPLFLAVNSAKDLRGLERVAGAVTKEGDLMLRLNEEFGLLYALLLVPPDTQKGSRRFPAVVKHALRSMEDEPTVRRQQYLDLVRAGDINGKARLVEEIGEEGARRYAARVGYESLFEGRPGKGMGFDQVYRDGPRIKAIEAKG